MHVIEIRNLSKQFGTKTVLNNITFSLNQGEVLGILGPNGAGKTTLLKIICGLVKPTRGEVSLNGVSGIQIATIFEDQRFLGHLSGITNMKLLLKTLYEKDFSLSERFIRFGLGECKKVKYKFYSSGMKRKLDLMSIFVSGKQLFVLDEPTNGLDIDSIIALNEQIMALKNQGKSLIISSHRASELEKICDFFLMIDSGAVVSHMSKQELLRGFNSLEYAYRSILHSSKTNNFFA
jgi:ABC-2 type transport system ATP-binding protein